MEIGPDGKPCRACISVEEMMERGRQMAAKAKAKRESETGQAQTEGTSKTAPGPGGTTGSLGAHPVQCPVDKDELECLGRSTWNLLHTMSVYYPENPNEEQKKTVATFMDSLGKTYPCDFCAKDLRKDLYQDPPKLGSKAEFADWMCRLHNKVNAKTGKAEFDCSKVFERWKDGWKDGSCDY